MQPVDPSSRCCSFYTRHTPLLFHNINMASVMELNDTRNTECKYRWSASVTSSFAGPNTRKRLECREIGCQTPRVSRGTRASQPQSQSWHPDAKASKGVTSRAILTPEDTLVGDSQSSGEGERGEDAEESQYGSDVQTETSTAMDPSSLGTSRASSVASTSRRKISRRAGLKHTSQILRTLSRQNVKTRWQCHR